MADIAIRDLGKFYGKQQIFKSLNLDVVSREFLVILGPSGCGKSTLLRLIAGLESIDAGEVLINGTKVNALEPRDRGCAMVFQNYALYPHMSVANNIGYALRVAGIPVKERRQRVEAVAKILELQDYLDRKPAQLSGGQRQRVAMGRAIIREPKVFLFDEPLSNLDAKLRVSMRLEIRKLHKRLGVTSLFVTHDQVEAMTLADRLVVMNDGQIEQIGTPEEIYDRPASSYVAGFVGSPPMNLLIAHYSDSTRTFTFGDSQQININNYPLQVSDGSDVMVGIRADQLSLNMDNHSPTSVQARIDFVEDLGSARLYHCRMGHSAIVVQTSEKKRMQPGDTINLNFIEEEMHFFNTSTGFRY